MYVNKSTAVYIDAYIEILFKLTKLWNISVLIYNIWYLLYYAKCYAVIFRRSELYLLTSNPVWQLDIQINLIYFDKSDLNCHIRLFFFI